MENKRIEINLNTVDKIKKFINVSRGFSSDIDVIAERAVVDAKSILALYALDLSKNVSVRIITDDAEEFNRFEKAMEDFK